MPQSQQKSSAFSSAEMFKKPLWKTGHEFELLYSFVEIIFSLLLIPMRVFNKYLIRINPLKSSGIGYIDRYLDMTKIDKKYIHGHKASNKHAHFRRLAGVSP